MSPVVGPLKTGTGVGKVDGSVFDYLNFHMMVQIYFDAFTKSDVF